MGFYTVQYSYSPSFSAYSSPWKSFLWVFSLSVLSFLSFFFFLFSSYQFNLLNFLLFRPACLHSKGSNFSASLSLKPNKHNVKKPQYPLKSALPTVLKDFLTQLVLSWHIQCFFHADFLVFLSSIYYRPMSTQIHTYISAPHLLWTSVISV